MMITKTSGLVLRTIKHSDKSSVITVYTREYGRVTYIAYGLNGKKSAIRTACFLPLSIIEITEAHRPGKEIRQLKEARILHNLNLIYNHPVKNALIFFIAELLYKTLKQPEPEPQLFDFLEYSILSLEHNKDKLSDFHLTFMIRLSSYLGFKPNEENKENARYFDLMNGIFLSHQPLHKHFLSPDMTLVFSSLLSISSESGENLRISRGKRSQLLEILMEYYKLHIPDFYGLNSVSVLHELFN